MRRCAGIIRGTVSPHGDGHLLDVTVSHAFGGSQNHTVALANAFSLLPVFLKTRRSARLWLRLYRSKVALEPCPWSIGRLRAPDAVVANRRSA